MATNMPPHNLVEVIGAARHLLAHPEATLDDLMRFVPGPDLPTGGKIIGLDGDPGGVRDRPGHVPYPGHHPDRERDGAPEGDRRHRAPLRRGARAGGGEDRRAGARQEAAGHLRRHRLTDRARGCAWSIELKNGFVPEAVLDQLYRLTPMEESFAINNVALVEGQPRTLGLRELLRGLRRPPPGGRTPPLRTIAGARTRTRLHLVDGLLIAILDIDEVIAVIRSSDDTAAARERLMAVFDLSGPRPTTSWRCRCAS